MLQIKIKNIHPKQVANPIKKKSNIVKGCTPLFSINPLRTKLVEVPITVIIPPVIAAKDNGIKNLDGDCSCFLDHLVIYGIIRATTGVLFINDEIKATKELIWNKKSFGFWFLVKSLSKYFKILKFELIAEVINININMIANDLFAKLSKKVFTSRTLKIIKISAENKNKTRGFILSVTNPIISADITNKTKYIGFN